MKSGKKTLLQNATPPWLKWLALGVLAAWLAYHLATLTTYPVTWCDEATYVNAADAFRHTGRFTLPIHREVVGTDRNWSTGGRLYLIGLSAVLSVLKTGLWQARLYTVLAWAASVVMLYLVAREWYGPSVAALAALVYGVGFETYIRSHLARPDTWAVAAVLLEIYLFQQAKRCPTRLRLAVVGLVGMLAVDVYWNAIHFGLAMALLVVITFGLRMKRLDLVLAYAAGGLLGVAYFVAAHAYPDPQAAYSQWFVQLPGLGYGTPLRVYNTPLFWLIMFFWKSDRGITALQTILFLTGMGLAAWKGRRAADRELVTMTIISWVAFALIFYDQNWTQVGAWLPFIALWIVRGADVAARWLVSGVARFQLPPLNHPAWMAILLAPWLVINIAAGLYMGVKFRPHQPQAYLSSVEAYIPPDATGVLGRGIWWFGIPESEFMHAFAIYHYAAYEYGGRMPEEAAVRWLDDQRIEYVIWESGFECSYSLLAPPGVTMEELLAGYCSPVGSLENPYYGLSSPGAIGDSLPTTVYHCDFSGK
jgi:hypothetical protein